MLARLARLHLAQAATKVLQTGGAALGPRVKVVAMLRRAAAATTEAGFQLAQTVSPGHSFAALLAGEAAYRVAASHISPANDGCADAEHDYAHKGKRSCRDDAVEHPTQHLTGDRRPCAGHLCCLCSEGRHH